MKRQRVWLAMCVIGTLAPYAAFAPWLMRNGFDLGRLYAEASGTPIAAFAWLDVLVSAVVVLLLAVRRLRKGDGRFWLVVVGTFVVGVSLSLPLYLYLQEGGTDTA